jgi:hypothetical protein
LRFDLSQPPEPLWPISRQNATDPLFYLLAILAVTFLGLGRGGFAHCWSGFGLQNVDNGPL